MVASLQSTSARAAISYARLGVEPPVSTMCPPAFTASRTIPDTTSAGFSSTRMSNSDHHRLGRFQRRTICRIAQQRLPHALAEDAALTAGGAHHHPRALGTGA